MSLRIEMKKNNDREALLDEKDQKIELLESAVQAISRK